MRTAVISKWQRKGRKKEGLQIGGDRGGDLQKYREGRGKEGRRRDCR
jgi:hypothetical protein